MRGVGKERRSWVWDPFGRQSEHMRTMDGLDVAGKKEAGAPGCRDRDGEAREGDRWRF